MPSFLPANATNTVASHKSPGCYSRELWSQEATRLAYNFRYVIPPTRSECRIRHHDLPAELNKSLSRDVAMGVSVVSGAACRKAKVTTKFNLKKKEKKKPRGEPVEFDHKTRTLGSSSPTNVFRGSASFVKGSIQSARPSSRVQVAVQYPGRGRIAASQPHVAFHLSRHTLELVRQDALLHTCLLCIVAFPGDRTTSHLRCRKCTLHARVRWEKPTTWPSGAPCSPSPAYHLGRKL